MWVCMSPHVCESLHACEHVCGGQRLILGLFLYTETEYLPVNMKSCVYWGGISLCEHEILCILRRDLSLWTEALISHVLGIPCLYLPPYRDYRLAMTPAWLLCGFWGSMLCYPGLHGKHLIHQAISPALKFLFLKMLLSSKARVESSQVTGEIIEHFSIFFFPMVPRIKPWAPCKLGKHAIVEIHPSPWDRFLTVDPRECVTNLKSDSTFNPVITQKLGQHRNCGLTVLGIFGAVVPAGV